jgi:competence CoiA-like predicted nuclease
MANVLYKYAIDENDKRLVCIDNFDKKFGVVHTYRCPNCGAIMIAKPGNGGRTPHFAHKYVMECNGETYLHKMAKLVLQKRWYDNTQDFTIKYKQIYYV